MTDVILCECFARDGLQHEAELVPTETKRALIERFAALGFKRVEATSYSNPRDAVFWAAVGLWARNIVSNCGEVLRRARREAKFHRSKRRNAASTSSSVAN